MEIRANILIVDDSINLLKTMSLILSKKGYSVTTAKDGPGAISIVDKESFDIIFMDIKMPLLNGVETYKKIKKIRPEAVVMMMTAYAVKDLIQEAMQEGVHGIIYKPLDFEKVINLIEKSKSEKKSGLILIADDDPAVCTTFKKILEGKGYRVRSSSTGEEAILLAKENNFDLIFIDIKLPTINGLETYLRIKKANPKIIVVMITGYKIEMNDIVEEAMTKKAYTCLYKPLDMNEVLNLVDEVIAKKQ